MRGEHSSPAEALAFASAAFFGLSIGALCIFGDIDIALLQLLRYHYCCCHYAGAFETGAVAVLTALCGRDTTAGFAQKYLVDCVGIALVSSWALRVPAHVQLAAYAGMVVLAWVPVSLWRPGLSNPEWRVAGSPPRAEP